MPSLEGPFLRIAVAKEKTAQLRAEFEAAVTALSVPAAPVKHHPKTGRNTILIRAPQVCDPRWSITIGEVCHNLRAALDGLVYQLALSNVSSESVDRNTAFPIFLSREDREVAGRKREGFATGSKRQLQLLRADHRAHFEQFQPFVRGNGGTKSPLWQLHQLNITDKHRLVPVIALVAHGIRVCVLNKSGHRVAVECRDRRMRRIESGTVVTLPFKGRKHPDVRIHAEFALDVRFGRDCGVVATLGVTSALRRMCSEVERVVQSFSSCFGDPPR